MMKKSKNKKRRMRLIPLEKTLRSQFLLPQVTPMM